MILFEARRFDQKYFVCLFSTHTPHGFSSFFVSAAIFCKESISDNLLVLISGVGYQYVWMLAYKQTDRQVH